MGEIYEELRNLFGRLRFRLSTTQDVNLYLAGDFNVFNHINPDENRLSDIIQDLLCPQGTHGQRDIFLKEFLAVIGKADFTNTENAKVVREEPTCYTSRPQRRIDITVDLKNRLGIGVENKPWAQEQPGWVSDYYNHLNQRFDRFVLVYISSDGRRPEDIDEQECARLEMEGRFVCMSYPGEFRDWLESCYKQCRADKMRWFLRDFIGYVEAMGVRSMVSENERNTTVRYLLEHPEDLTIAQTVSIAFDEVRKAIVVNFLNALEKALRDELVGEWEIENPGENILKRYNGFSVYKRQWTEDRAISLVPEDAEANGFGIGVRKRKDAAPFGGGHLSAALNERYAESKPWPYWEWWLKILNEYQNWSDPNTLVKINAKKEPLEYFLHEFLTIREIVEPILDEVR